MSHYVSIEYSDHTYNATVMGEGDLSFYLRNDKRHIVSIKPMDDAVLPEWLTAEIKEALPLSEEVDFSGLKAAVSKARNKAQAIARKDYSFVRSRGAEISASLEGSDPFTQELSTKKELLEVVEHLAALGVSEISIDGCFDAADTLRDLNDGGYDPRVSEWSVPVWDAINGFIQPKNMNLEVA